MDNTNYSKSDIEKLSCKAFNLKNLLLAISNGAFINSRFSGILSGSETQEEIFDKMWDWFAEYYSLLSSSIESAYLLSCDISSYFDDISSI